MNLHELTNEPGAIHRRKRVGRGEGNGLGKTCGRGHKGQMARSGHKHKAGFEGGQTPLIRRIPKRGFHNLNRIVYEPINLGALARFEDGTVVTPESLVAAGLVRAGCLVKVLAGGDLARKLTVRVHACSAAARTRIEQAGGTCEGIAKN